VLRRDRGGLLEDGPLDTFPARRGGQRSLKAPEVVKVEALNESSNVNVNTVSSKIEFEMFVSVGTESLH